MKCTFNRLTSRLHRTTERMTEWEAGSIEIAQIEMQRKKELKKEKKKKKRNRTSFKNSRTMLKVITYVSLKYQMRKKRQLNI